MLLRFLYKLYPRSISAISMYTGGKLELSCLISFRYCGLIKVCFSLLLLFCHLYQLVTLLETY